MPTRVAQTCHAVACRALLLPSELFCDRHQRMLQTDLKTILYRQFRPGQKQSKLFAVTLERAQHEILYAQTAGHRVPRDAEFEW
jgi:hypothetical protein